MQIIAKYAPDKSVTLESDIKKELGIDSLSIFEMSMEIEDELGVKVVNRWERIRFVGDILNIRETDSTDVKSYDINEFPLKRSSKDLAFIKRFGSFSRFMYRLEAIGTENIPKDETVMFCPNHESYLDAMWVACALEKQGFELSNLSCLAAEHLKDKRMMKKAFRALGGIPVDRSGNTAPAMKRAEEVLKQDGAYMIIHPEGTRSRSGKLGEFKLGAAKLAKETGVKIVPVCIDGAFEIYPPNAKLPHLFHWKKLQRYSVKITFGEAINVENKSKEEITEKIKSFIVETKVEK